MRINKKVMNASGTWIDWQHLFEAASLLARCRYTLQYTYPYAYYMEPGPRKELVRFRSRDVKCSIRLGLNWESLCLPVRVSASSIRSGNRESFVEDRASGDNGSRWSGESNGYRGKTSRHITEGFPRSLIQICMSDVILLVFIPRCFKILHFFLCKNGCSSDVFQRWWF